MTAAKGFLRRSTYYQALTLILVGAIAVPSWGADDTVFFVVRHAEKASGTGDVPLSDAGKARAALLAQVLSALRVSSIYHTDTLRAKETAAPAASQIGLTTHVYSDPDPAWIASLLTAEQGKRILIVGHSNTIHEIVGRLTGHVVPPIGEHFDDLFIVVVNNSDKSLVHLKYGEPN